MNFKYKNILSLYIQSIFASCFFVNVASADNLFTTSVVVPPSVPPSASLYLPTASLSAYSGVGAAAPGDYSAVDVNPAIMSALKKQYTLFGNTAWQTNDKLIELGVFDNSTTQVSTLIRIRESVPNQDDTRDRRYTLGISYQIPKTHISFGISLDYEQLTLTNLTSSKDFNYFAGTGFLYEYTMTSGRPIFIGGGMNRIFDAYGSIIYDVGISTTFLEGFYSISLDTLSSNLSGLNKIVGSLDIIANHFLDLKGSYGYATRDQKAVWGGGVFFHGPVLQLFYTFASSDSNASSTLRQTAGCALNFNF